MHGCPTHDSCVFASHPFCSLTNFRSFSRFDHRTTERRPVPLSWRYLPQSRRAQSPIIFSIIFIQTPRRIGATRLSNACHPFTRPQLICDQPPPSYRSLMTRGAQATCKRATQSTILLRPFVQPPDRFAAWPLINFASNKHKKGCAPSPFTFLSKRDSYQPSTLRPCRLTLYLLPAVLLHRYTSLLP